MEDGLSEGPMAHGRVGVLAVVLAVVAGFGRTEIGPHIRAADFPCAEVYFPSADLEVVGLVLPNQADLAEPGSHPEAGGQPERYESRHHLVGPAIHSLAGPAAEETELGFRKGGHESDSLDAGVAESEAVNSSGRIPELAAC